MLCSWQIHNNTEQIMAGGGKIKIVMLTAGAIMTCFLLYVPITGRCYALNTFQSNPGRRKNLNIKGRSSSSPSSPPPSRSNSNNNTKQQQASSTSTSLPTLQQPVVFASCLSTILATSLLLGFGVISFPLPSIASNFADELHEWDLMNGNVQLPNQLELLVPSSSSTSSSSNQQQKLKLSNPKLVGAGGGGAVFAFDDTSNLLKVSWDGSTKTVQRECQTLQYLQSQQVLTAERCLATFDYPYDGDSTSTTTKKNASNRRIMILVEPYVKDAVASVMEVVPSSGQQARLHAVEQIAQTLVQMLAANTITIDVQPLISQQSGDVIFIDMTEAQILSPSIIRFLDKTLISAFISEMAALIPDEFTQIANKAISNELHLLKERRGIVLPIEVMEILESQFELTT